MNSYLQPIGNWNVGILDVGILDVGSLDAGCWISINMMWPDNKCLMLDNRVMIDD